MASLRWLWASRKRRWKWIHLGPGATNSQMIPWKLCAIEWSMMIFSNVPSNGPRQHGVWPMTWKNNPSNPRIKVEYHWYILCLYVYIYIYIIFFKKYPKFKRNIEAMYLNLWHWSLDVFSGLTFWANPNGIITLPPRKKILIYIYNNNNNHHHHHQLVELHYMMEKGAGHKLKPNMGNIRELSFVDDTHDVGHSLHIGEWTPYRIVL